MTLDWKPAIADALAADLEQVIGNETDYVPSWQWVADRLVDLGWRPGGAS